MKVFLIVILVFLSVDAQPDCPDLGFGTASQASDGSDLIYCRTNEQQCCSNSYLDNRFNELSDTVTGEIRDELNRQINSLGEVVDGMEDYLRSVFIPRFSSGFCSNLITEEQCKTAIQSAERSLLMHLHINEDEETDPTVIRDHTTGYSAARAVSEYFHDSIKGLSDYYLASRSEETINEDYLRCLRNYTLASPQSEQYVYDNLTQIRKSFTSLRRLRFHVNNTILPDLLKIKPTDSCVESFVNLTCQACVEDIPDTCQGACNAVLYGCLAPFRDGLREEFNLLWSTVGQIISITNGLLPITRAVPSLTFAVNISKASEVHELAVRCGITLTTPSTASNNSMTMGTTDNGTAANDDEDVLPESVSTLAERLLDSGAFNDSEPSTCLQYGNDNCWNGTANVTMDNVYFTDKTVEGQGDNPLANYNITTLRIFAEESFSMFVTGFLDSPYFLDVAPEGLFLPFNTSSNSTDVLPTDFDGNNSAGIASVGLFLFLATLIVGLFLN